MQRNPTNGNSSPVRAPVRKLGGETLVPINPEQATSTLGKRAQAAESTFGKWIAKQFDLTPPPSNGLLDRALNADPVKKPATGTPRTPNTPQHPAATFSGTNGRVSPPKYLSTNSSPNISPKHMNGHAVNVDAKHANGVNGIMVDETKATKLILEKIQLIQNNVQGSFDPFKQVINVVMENVKTILHDKDRCVGIENLTTHLETILALDVSSATSIAEAKQAIERIQFKFPHEYRIDQLLQEIKGMLTANDDDQAVSLLQRFERELGSYTRPVLTSIKAKEEFQNNFDFMMYLFKIHFGQAHADAIVISKSTELTRQNRVLKAELRKKLTQEQQKTREIDFLSNGFVPQPTQGLVVQQDVKDAPKANVQPTVATIDILPATNLEGSLSFKAIPKTAEPDKKEMTLPMQSLIWELNSCHLKFMEKIIPLKNNHIFSFLKEISKLDITISQSNFDTKLFSLKKLTTITLEIEDILHTLFKLKNLQIKINKLAELDATVDMTLPYYQLPNACNAEELKKFNDAQHVKAFNGWIDQASKAINESDLMAELTIKDKSDEEKMALLAQKADHQENVPAELLDGANEFLHPKTPVASGKKSGSRRSSVVEEAKEVKIAEPDSPSSTGESKTETSPVNGKERPKTVTFEDDEEHMVREGSEEEGLLHPERTSSSSPTARNFSMVARRGSSVDEQPTNSSKWTKRLGIVGMFLGAAVGTALLLIPGVNIVAALGIAVWGIVTISTAGGGLIGGGIGRTIDSKCLPCCGSTKKIVVARTPQRKAEVQAKEEERTNSTKIFTYVGNPSAPVNIGGDKQDSRTVYTQDNPPPTVSTYTPPANTRHLRRSSRSPSPN